MKKGFVLIFLSFFILGIALSSPIIFADEDNDSKNESSNSGSGSSGDDLNETEDGEKDDDEETEERDDSSGKGSRDRTKFEREIKDGEERIKFEIRRRIVDEDGNVREIRIKIEERIVDGEIIRKIKISDRIRGDIEAKTKLKLIEVVKGNESIIRAILSNGNETDINILPDRIAEIALERLKSRNFTIELKEDIHRNIPRVIYNIQTNKNGRFLGIFKLKLKIEAQIDPETGELIGISKPWWAFLVIGEDSDQTGDNGDDETGDNGNDLNETEDENQITVELTAENDSNESGIATLVEENEQVIINISLDGAPENVSQPAHIHLGSCPEVGGVQYPLTNILNGESITIINVTFDQLKSELPLAINIHKSVNESSVYVSCGNLIFN